MEPRVVRSRGRPRKREREDEVKKEGGNKRRGRPPKKKPIEIRGQALVGRYVFKEFEGSGVFLGKVVYYDTGLYRVDYEDGDCEDLDSSELREYLIDDNYFDNDLRERRKKLDERLARDSEKLKGEKVKGNAVKLVNKSEEDGKQLQDESNKADVAIAQNEGKKIEVSKCSDCHDGQDDEGEVDDDADSSSDSCEYEAWAMRSKTEAPTVPPPDLPPCSGTIGVPEEHVPHLLSVYGFLRSFSVRLFLSPFTLDDLVGCLNCVVPNTLLDAIHVSLLRTLRRHLEALSSDESELAAKCLRCVDWAFLDSLTWPIYMVHYLMTMGHVNSDDRNGLYGDVLEKEYCTLSVGRKLMVLQILCDDALDTAEIRAEINMREESEVGIDSDEIPFIPPGNGPRRTHPRYPKSSGGFQSNSVSSDLKGNDRNGDVVDADEDGNGDECRLCGMDGVLLCCDGCPSAYHPRCIGVSKMVIPDGQWFCPECTISKIGPAITIGTSLKGAEVFGIDSYEQVFLATCNHLLVLKISAKTSQLVRYYNCNDIIEVLRALNSSAHHAFSYYGICLAILKYWELPQDLLPHLEHVQALITSENKNEVAMLPTQVHPFIGSESREFSYKLGFDNYVSNVSQGPLDNVAGSGTEKLPEKHGLSDVCSHVGKETENAVPRDSDATTEQNVSVMSIKQPMHTNADSLLFMGQQAGLSGSIEGYPDRSSVTDVATCTSGYSSVSTRGRKNGVCLPLNNLVQGKKCTIGAGGGGDKKLKDNRYMGSLFKPYAYINNYMHGDFAASAAANLAALSSDENQISETRGSDPRKATAANVLLQVKAFSSAAARFFWPSTEKKLVEIPRERCSWCRSCKASITSKKPCLLNQAAVSATKAAMKIISGLRLSKSLDGGLYGLAIYTLYLEESLRGLVVGPFQGVSYREQWRKQVEQASTCSQVKARLLELEENLRPVALFVEWIKLVDNWMDENSMDPSTCLPGPSQKRGTSARRYRKHLNAAEAPIDDSSENSRDFCWWRRGKLSKLIFQKGTLPRAVLRKAARQGGSRRILGIHYAEGSDVPKRSRQFIWRAAVEMSKNVPQLALQVRHLDHHIRWVDLVRPEQTLVDGKETEASSFRNAFVCDKKVVENITVYGVVFGQQKHLSSRVMKSIVEKEETQDGKEKYWFLETRIPLYLIKEYEENAEKTAPSTTKSRATLSELQKRQLRISRRNIFSYLARKRENLEACFCASCQLDVLIRAAVTCGACEGYCHKECTLSSNISTVNNVEYIITCKKCHHGKTPQNNGNIESPTSPLAMPGQENSKSVSTSKSAKQKNDHQKLSSVETPMNPSGKKPISSNRSSTGKSKKRPCSWGLIWRKKNTEETGAEFKLRSILYRGNCDSMSFSEPVCHLCQKPYNPHLMYIRCESCQGWYHADAVELDESKLPNLVGFKCCRCRRIKSPVCPYADPDRKKPQGKKCIASEGSGGVSEQESSLPTTPFSPMEDVYIQVDDPFIFSIPEAELMPESNEEVDFEFNDHVDTPFFSDSRVEEIPQTDVDMDFEWESQVDPPLVSDSRVEQVPQKLPVRRQVKGGDSSAGYNDSHAEWDVSNDGLNNEYEKFYYENTDYEPQTYFSFTELLASDDGQVGADTSGFQGQCEMGFMDQHMEPAVDGCCSMCSLTTPTPDLSCQTCGLQIHSHCSPWEESPPGESWRCGNCKAWR